ncbi:hypothetical protein [Paenibacillus guangzhouensis]|uniref:hypothetical protein n=1 Tax=Paenibacillus guangzhouensis TaxID=1473112 RepID=UPI001266D0E2|nr:hypothetical protein [Paenibacillus guangzhouensis]
MIAMIFVLSQMGCSASGESGKVATQQGAKQTETASKGDRLAKAAPATITDVPTALSDMTSKVKAYKQAIESDQVEDAKKLADEIGSLWNAVKSKLSADLAEGQQTIHEDVSALMEETYQELWDKERLILLDYKIYQNLRDVRQAQEDQSTNN